MLGDSTSLFQEMMPIHILQVAEHSEIYYIYNGKVCNVRDSHTTLFMHICMGQSLYYIVPESVEYIGIKQSGVYGIYYSPKTT